MQPDPTQTDFSSLGIAPKLLDILNRLKITSPTPIQSQSIPKAIEGNDLIGIAQTGTGKTFAYGLPMIQKLCQSTQSEKGLIVVPTRELAIQVNESLKRIGASMGLKTCVLIGEKTPENSCVSSRPIHILSSAPQAGSWIIWTAKPLALAKSAW
jgi:superfamily II DNA/RNA helicase